MDLIINPGTGPVDGGSEERAAANVRQLFDDVGVVGRAVELVCRGSDDGGRYGFVVRVSPECDCTVPISEGAGQHAPGCACLGESAEIEVDMPGLPLREVRTDDLLRAPRLYVDGSSWWWPYALGVVADRLP